MIFFCCWCGREGGGVSVCRCCRRRGVCVFVLLLVRGVVFFAVAAGAFTRLLVCRLGTTAKNRQQQKIHPFRRWQARIKDLVQMIHYILLRMVLCRHKYGMHCVCYPLRLYTLKHVTNCLSLNTFPHGSHVRPAKSTRRLIIVR